MAAPHVDRNPRGQCCTLLDLTDMAMVSMDVQAIKTLLTLLGEHYVERLGALIFWNPPLIFWGVWNSLSPLLPEVTRAKIFVIDPSKTASLVELVGAEVLPTEYGGCAELAAPLGKQG
ncbi:CRAL-TRIO domain-containing protein [Haematococcus lacustris]|uniref:CRAL-TRIO domain-containing protein n=1 Tax=Haematococcus lacustris TaxID=44745 RepID=A0A6A0AA70_HAELA|nr:CRAL-TRIO domain-containing protein [Haematococcus lacustris]